MDAPPVDISTPGTERAGPLAAMFAAAFVDDPMMCWPMGDRPDRPDRLDRITRCFTCFLDSALAHRIVREVIPARAAAVWVAPGQFGPATLHPWDQPAILDLHPDGGRRYDEFWTWVEGNGPTDPLWLLDTIAVEPRLQGHGLARALILDGLARSRADGTGAHLSTATERNVAIYARYGFRVVKDLEAPGGGPRVWFMRWDP